MLFSSLGMVWEKESLGTIIEVQLFQGTQNTYSFAELIKKGDAVSVPASLVEKYDSFSILSYALHRYSLELENDHIVQV